MTKAKSKPSVAGANVPRFTSIEELREQFSKTKDVTFKCPLTAVPLTFQVRALNANELDEANRLTMSVVAPMRKTVIGSGATARTEEEIDWSDPKYRQLMSDASRERADYLLVNGLVGITYKTESVKTRGEELRAVLPQSVRDLLVTEIDTISGGTLEVVELGNFTSGDPSSGSPS